MEKEKPRGLCVFSFDTAFSAFIQLFQDHMDLWTKKKEVESKEVVLVDLGTQHLGQLLERMLRIP